MDKYTLFLDESSDPQKGWILVSGFAIPNSQIELFNQSILEIKKIIWDDEYICNHSTVLHCTELSLIYNNRNNPELYKYIKRDEYSVFKHIDNKKIKEIYDKIYGKLCEVIRIYDITIFGCLIDKNRLRYLFDVSSQKLLEDSYNISIQVIIENFTHFLNKRNGVGYIIYESRNSEDNLSKKSPDVKMYENFCKIKSVSKGIPHINLNSIANRIRYFNIIRKTNENAGLELADFITFNLFKSFSINDLDKSEFIKKIENKLYNGNFLDTDRNLRYFYGVRIIPEDYEKINLLNKELIRIKKSYKNIKKEKDDLLEKNNLLKKEKDSLKEKITELENKLSRYDKETPK